MSALHSKLVRWLIRRLGAVDTPLVLTPLMATLVVAGCATAPVPEAQPRLDKSAVHERGPEKSAEAKAEPAPPAEPVYSDFDSGTLNKLLVAEFAAHRGDLVLAVKNYLEAARETRDAGVAQRATSLALHARDNAASLAAASQWASLDADNADAVAMHAALLVRNGRTDRALARFNDMITMAGDQRRVAYSRITEILGRSGKPQEAFALMESLLVGRPNDQDAQFALAELAARLGMTERAITELKGLREASPDEERTFDFSARVLQSAQRGEEALQVLESYLARQPEAHRARMTYGRMLVTAERFADAGEQFEQLTESLPDSAEARHAYAIVLLQNEQYEAAKEQFEALINAGKRSDSSHYYIGQIEEILDNDTAALEAYRNVYAGELRLNAQMRVAVLTAKAGNVNEARARLQGLRRSYPSEAIRLYRAEAELLANRQNYDGAIGIYDQALQAHPQNTDLLYSRAMVAVRAERIAMFERDLRDILSREPENADALNALGYTLADKTDRFQEALGLIERAIALKPNDHYIIDSLGWVLHKLERHEEALEHLVRARDISPDAEISAHIVKVLWTLGRQDEARAALREALERDPEDKALLDELRQIDAR